MLFRRFLKQEKELTNRNFFDMVAISGNEIDRLCASGPLWMRKKESRKILICKTCGGSGIVRLPDALIFPEPKDYVVSCSACGGSGRVVKVKQWHFEKFMKIEPECVEEQCVHD